MTNYRLAGRVSGAAAFVAAALLVAGAPASAAGDDRPAKASATQEETVAPENDTRKYCVERTGTGTILKSRVCKTRSEWIAKTGNDPALKQR